MSGSVGKKIISGIRNSKFHSFICRMIEKFEMEGLTLSYSQCGEDLILKTIFGKNKRQGFYVDIGCNNPIQKSNTFKLYLKGWNGICADGNADLVKKFKNIRKRDICLQAILSDSKREVIFYQDDANHELSSIALNRGTTLKASNQNLKEIKTYSRTLEDIFDEHVKSQQIDLLCVDVEEHDLEVLRGNNYEKYRPGIICVEFDNGIHALGGSGLDSFLVDKGYKLLAFSSPNAFYRDSFLKEK
jgi:FkbM family methyltransferase